MSLAAEILEPVPEWVTKGWYEGDPLGLKMAIGRYRRPHASPEERQQSNAYAVERDSIIRQGDPLYELGFPCTSCKQFAFAQPTLCFWCR